MSYRAFVRMATGQDIRGSLDYYKRKKLFSLGNRAPTSHQYPLGSKACLLAV